MPDIEITDTLSAEIGSVSVDPKSAISAIQKYVRNPAVRMALLPELVKALNQPLLTARETPLSLGLKFADTVDLGTSAKPELTIKADVTQKVNVNAAPGTKLFPVDFFGAPVIVANGEGWLSLALESTVNFGLSETASDLTFGFDAGGGVETEYFRRFAVDATTPTIAQALGAVLSGFTLPGDVDDLNAMQTGDISTVSGKGSFKVSADVTVSASANPLATPNLPLVDQAIQLKAGASIDVDASFKLSGEYQIRARKLAEHSVELGYYRKKGTQWSVAATASAGVGVVLDKTDILAKLLGALTGKPGADITLLTSAGLKADEIAQIQDEIDKSINHSLKASLELELSGAETDEAAFLYRIDTSELNPESSAALHTALDGDLSRLTGLEKHDDGNGVIANGITMLRSSLKNVRNRKASLKINLLGLLNFSSVFELIQKSDVVYEPVTGDLTISETVSGTRIGILTLPEEQEKLRKIKFDSLLVTTAYRASGALGTMHVTSSDAHFAFNQNTNEHTLSDYLDGLMALGLLDAGLKPRLMAGFHGGGPSTCLLRVEFGDAACAAMFLNAAGAPRPQTEYEAIGRNALRELLLPGDQNDGDRYRREILASDGIWAQLKERGQPGFGQALPALASDSIRLSVVRSDYTVVMWWAESMASTAKKLAAVRSFLGATDPVTLRGNNTFKALRNDLQKHVAGVVAKSGLQFGLPFGLVALYGAAFPLAIPYGIIFSDALTRVFTPDPAAGGVPLEGAANPASPAPAGA